MLQERVQAVQVLEIQGAEFLVHLLPQLPLLGGALLHLGDAVQPVVLALGALQLMGALHGGHLLVLGVRLDLRQVQQVLLIDQLQHLGVALVLLPLLGIAGVLLDPGFLDGVRLHVGQQLRLILGQLLLLLRGGLLGVLPVLGYLLQQLVLELKPVGAFLLAGSEAGSQGGDLQLVQLLVVFLLGGDLLLVVFPGQLSLGGEEGLIALQGPGRLFLLPVVAPVTTVAAIAASSAGAAAVVRILPAQEPHLPIQEFLIGATHDIRGIAQAVDLGLPALPVPGSGCRCELRFRGRQLLLDLRLVLDDSLADLIERLLAGLLAFRELHAVHLPEAAHIVSGAAGDLVGRRAVLLRSDRLDEVAQRQDGIFDEAGILPEREREPLPGGLQGSHRALGRVHLLLGDILQDAARILQLGAERDGGVCARQEGVERGDGALIGQLERGGQIDALGVQALQAIHQLREGPDRLAERLGELAVGVREIQDDIPGCRGGGRRLEARIRERAEQRGRILDAEAERLGHGADGREGGLVIVEGKGALVRRQGKRGQDVLRVLRLQAEHAQRGSGQGGRLGEVGADGGGEVQDRLAHGDDLPLGEAELRQLDLQAGGLRRRVLRGGAQAQGLIRQQ